MTLLQPLLMEAVTGDTAITYHAQDYRNIIAALAPGAGTVLAGDLAVTQRGAGANMSVDVAAGTCFIKGGSVSRQGTYICPSDATFNVAISAANATNPRKTIIVAQLHDKQADGGSTYGWTLTAIDGTPAASPVAPSVPTSALLLATVTVPANAASIVNSNIADGRVLAGVGDVPKWEMVGTTGTPQSIGTTTLTAYAYGTLTQMVGVTPVTAGFGQVTCVTPGRYAVSFCARLAGTGAACNRTVTLTVNRAAGGSREIANGGFFSSNLPLGVSANLYLNAGDQVLAYLYQDSGGSVSVDESKSDAAFAGVWVGR